DFSLPALRRRICVARRLDPRRIHGARADEAGRLPLVVPARSGARARPGRGSRAELDGGRLARYPPREGIGTAGTLGDRRRCAPRARCGDRLVPVAPRYAFPLNAYFAAF